MNDKPRCNVLLGLAVVCLFFSSVLICVGASDPAFQQEIRREINQKDSIQRTEAQKKDSIQRTEAQRKDSIQRTEVQEQSRMAAMSGNTDNNWLYWILIFNPVSLILIFYIIVLIVKKFLGS